MLDYRLLHMLDHSPFRPGAFYMLDDFQLYECVEVNRKTRHIRFWRIGSPSWIEERRERNPGTIGEGYVWLLIATYKHPVQFECCGWELDQP